MRARESVVPLSLGRARSERSATAEPRMREGKKEGEGEREGEGGREGGRERARRDR
jgi:hypothetical protein